MLHARSRQARVSGVRAVIAAAIACAACQGQPAAPAAGADQASGAPALDARDADAAPAGADARGAAGREPGAAGGPEDETPDPGRVIAELGAIPAWQAVVDRAQLLGRRGQHGVVYGRVGPPVMVPAPVPPAGAGDAGSAGGPPGGGSAAAGAGVGSAAAPAGTRAGSASPAGLGAVPGGAQPGSGSVAAYIGSGTAPARAAGAGPGAAAAGVGAGAGSGSAAPEAHLVAAPYVWLIDDTEGNGTLGIRIALGDKARPGDRIAAGGAWQLDAEHRWYWKPDAIQPLPAAPASEPKDPPPPVPSHAIATGPLPPGARTAGVARDNDAIYFQLVGPAPQSDGDGWQVADQLGSPTALVLNLPGERASYGGQDMRAPDERWQLRRGQTYWVRIGVLHRRTGKPATAGARTAPVRVP
jgi:hypothetical protein